MFNINKIKQSSKDWKSSKPFPHFVIDDFFDKDIANVLEKEFPSFNSNVWHKYNNAIEVKKVCNDWNSFPETTYKVFSRLNSESFVKNLSEIIFGTEILFPDNGLNGGGWHIHARDGKLNSHLDYSIHPKLGLQRKLNIIIYLNSNWEKSWGGSLGLWGNESSLKPGKLTKVIEPKFNRAIVFDTTCNSWHGLPDPLTCPKNEFRKSLAVYYLVEPHKNVDSRGKALFAPTPEQMNDKKVLDLINKRSSVNTAHEVYDNK